MTMIQQLSDNAFYLESRGNKMTLTQEIWGGSLLWIMRVDNASVRAWRSLGEKHFNNLAEVEKKYKSWRGIAALINS